MHHLVKLTVIAGGLVLVLAAVLGIVIVEFTAGLDRFESREPLERERTPIGKPGMQAPVRPGFVPRLETRRLEWS